MTTYLEYRAGKLPDCIVALSRFPANKIGPSLLSIIRSTINGVILVDDTQHIVLVNHKVGHMFGYLAKHMLEKPLDIIMPPPRLATEQRRRIDHMVATRLHGRKAKLELKGIRANREQRSLHASITRVAVHGELFLALILHNSVAHRFPHENQQHPERPSELRRKRAVSSQQANEVEKRRFSKKLYDDIGQRLSVLKLDLDWLEHNLSGTDENLPARLAQMQGLLDNVITMTKSMASALRPPLLDDFGLMPAVEWMAENFQKNTSIRCTVESSGMAAPLDDPIESVIFRIIQEGLSNIERHAHASNAKIAFRHSGNQLDVMIQDDGIGMTNGSESKPGCYGLIAMQERIFILGGTISIRNAKPRGVEIHAAIPIEPNFYPEPISQPPTTRL